MSFSTSKKGLWHILVGLHRLIALHISHAMCKDIVAGHNDKMPTYYASSIAAASFLLLLAVGPALCNSPNRKVHSASIASALPPCCKRLRFWCRLYVSEGRRWWGAAGDGGTGLQRRR